MDEIIYEDARMMPSLPDGEERAKLLKKLLDDAFRDGPPDAVIIYTLRLDGTHNHSRVGSMGSIVNLRLLMMMGERQLADMIERSLKPPKLNG